MVLQRVEFKQLTGVNRNAVDGVTQETPEVLKGFDLNRAGGYYVGWAKADQTVTEGLSGDVRAYDNYGLYLLGNDSFVLNDDLIDLSEASTRNKRVYIIPRVGVASHAVTTAEDKYDVGAYFRDINGRTGDIYRLDSGSISSSGSSASGETWKVQAWVFAPTAQGLLGYEHLNETLTVTTGSKIDITSNRFLPAGYEVKSYAAQEFDGAFSEFNGVPIDNRSSVFSNGEGNLTSVIDTSLSGSAKTFTSDAIINFCGKIGCVESHRERMWSRASAVPFIGPFFEGYLTTNRFDLDWQVVPNQTVSNEFFNAESGTVLVSSNSSFSVNLDFDDGIFQDFVVAPSLSASSGSHVLSFFEELDGGSEHLSFGLKTVFESQGVGTLYTASMKQYFRLFFDGVEYLTPYREKFLAQNSVAPINFVFDERDFSLENVSFELESGTLLVTVTDADDAVESVHTVGPNVTFDGSYVQYDSSQVTVGSAIATVSVSGSYATPASGSINAWSYNYDYSNSVSGDVATQFFSIELSADGVASLRVSGADYSVESALTSSTTGEVWTYNRQGDYKGLIQLLAPESANLAALNTKATVVYSDIGYVNFASSTEQYIQLELNVSDEITALTSTPAGLLVFADNESFLIRGDQALGNLEVQRFTGNLGCDDGVRPARLGGNVFPIWKGRIYSILLGMGDVDFGGNFQDLTADIFDPEDPFVQVVSEPRARQLVARTQAGKVFRYSTDTSQWFTDVWTDEPALTYLLPNSDDKGTRYLVGSNLRYAREFGSNAEVTWRNVDLGSKDVVKQWRRFRAFFGDNYSGSPTLEYSINDASGSVVGSEEGQGWYVFTLPRGVTGVKAESITVRMNDANYGDVFEPPFVMEFVERYSRR